MWVWTVHLHCSAVSYTEGKLVVEGNKLLLYMLLHLVSWKCDVFCYHLWKLQGRQGMKGDAGQPGLPGRSVNWHILHYSWCNLAAGQLSLTSLGVTGSSHTSPGHGFGNTVILHLEIWNIGNSKLFKTASMKKQLFLVKSSVHLDSCKCKNGRPLD